MYTYIGVGKEPHNRWNIPIAFKDDKEANLFLMSKPELFDWKPSLFQGGIIPGQEWISAFKTWSRHTGFDINLYQDRKTKGGNIYATGEL